MSVAEAKLLGEVPQPLIVGLEDLINSQRIPQLTYLAGYPRSGAALIRTILAHCFGQYTASIYPEHFLAPTYQEAVKLLPDDLRVAKVQEIAETQGILAVKTHNEPVEPMQVSTIVIVRDGRRTLESLFHFYRERNGLEFTMRDLVCNDHSWGSWSRWVRSWQRFAPADALWLRYEDVMASTEATVDRLAVRFRIKPIGYEIPPFEQLRQGEPTIFRGCKVAGNGGMTEEEEHIFWHIHGAEMASLGYDHDA